MAPHRRLLSQLTSLLMAVIIGASTVAPGLADTPSGPPQLPPPADDAQRAYHDQTGKLRFLAAQPGSAIAIPGAQEATTAEGKALAALSVYGQEFGLSNPAQELQVMEAPASTSGPAFIRYQQVYQGIPVLAGEMIVGTDEVGNLLSMSGEVSPQPSLSVTPGITIEQARTTTLEAAAKWYELTPADLTTTEPQLWIYDERLLQPSTRPAELVWRMEVTATDLQPIDELVLVNAHTGGISLHFNQIDAAWGETPHTTYNPLMQAPATLYVATTGNDSNSCTTTGAPCATINGAIGKAAASGDTIKVAVGTYTGTGTEVVLVNKSVTLSGGWDAAFATQSGMSTIDGQKVKQGIGLINGTTSAIGHFIVQNGVASFGGGINNNGTLILSDTTIVGNNTGTSGGLGGGIYSSGALTLNNVTVTGNSAGYYGGGIANGGTQMTLNNSTVSNNTGGDRGGGIYNSNGILVLNNSTISGNTSARGGGIYSEFSDSNITLNSSTISNNDPYGIYVSSGNVALRNSILAGNTASGSISVDCYGPVSSLGYNLIGNASPCFTSTTGDLTNINANIGSLIGTPGYHPLISGSPAINAGNPTGCVGSTGTLNNDQRGVSRVGRCDIGAYEYTAPGLAASISAYSGTPQKTAPLSAFEMPLWAVVMDDIGSPVSNNTITFSAPTNGPSGMFINSGTSTTIATTNDSGLATAAIFSANGLQGSYTVTATVNGVASPVDFSLTNIANWYVSSEGNDANDCQTPVTPCASINGVLGKSNFVADDFVLVASGTYKNSGTEVALLNKNVRLFGGWSTSFTERNGATIIDGEGMRRGVRVYSGVTTRIEQFIIRNGSSIYTGGGIYNEGNLTVSNSVISNNSSKDGGGVSGAGGSIILRNSTISSNTASSMGGGIFNQSNSRTVLINSTLANNAASWGGGIYLYGPLKLQNSILAKNTALQGPDCYDYSLGPYSMISTGYNLVGASACDIGTTTGDHIGTPDNPINLALGPLQDNGGPTPTHALLAGSLAIDSGNPTTPGNSDIACLSTDQRGVVRPQGPRCDMGAFEGSLPSPLTYTANNGATVPGNFLCSQNQLLCTNGADPHADAAHLHAHQTDNFYTTYHNRDSINNAGMAIVSTVHYKSGYANAFWSGQYQQMVYGDAYGFPLADDVVAHELTHGVTDYESNLFYYYQSGAINESFSDVWGEFVDLTNGAGTDTASVRWKMGEDVSGLGAIRDMKNPPANGDPDKMTSSLYYKGAGDNGGVHTNSGVNNKAVYLMTDGGTFNGKTVTGLGIPKVAAIYYKVQTDLLTSGADYTDLYYALSQACASLVGGALGITNEDCQSVRDAADAVQMNSQPVANFNPEAALCPTNMALNSTLFFDDLEASIPNNWTFGSISGPATWSRSTDYAASGLFELYSSHTDFANSFAAMVADEPNLSANAFLHFKHSFGFEDSGASFWDGGIVEYSTDNGSTWFDAKPLFSDGKNYGGKIAAAGTFGNPLAGRDAFVANSHGYVSSRYNLSSLVGQNVRFRWRFGTDFIGGDLNWLVDDVRIYTCTGVPNIPSLLIPAANSLTTDYTPTLDWADSSPGLDHYQLQVDDNSDFLSLLLDQITTPSTYTFATPLAPAKTYYWRVRAFNGAGQSSDWSPTRTLYTAVVPPGVNFPANNGAVPTTRPLFDWANVTGATSYTLQISTQQNFSAFVLNQIISPSAYVMPTDLPRSALLFWRVRANGLHGSGDWSRVRHFDSANPPGVPVLVSPLNAAVVTLPPTLDWNDSSPAADYYEIQLSTNPTFATLLGRGFSGRSNQSSYIPSAALGSNTTYHWRVRAVNAAGQFSEWSAARNFQTPP
ncbi:MAG: M4 family metallopeptidase [Chloroflexi bacterium]|nr:M4 family metallopeptidase [Chloroflexota bacterium]